MTVFNSSSAYKTNYYVSKKKSGYVTNPNEWDVRYTFLWSERRL